MISRIIFTHTAISLHTKESSQQAIRTRIHFIALLFETYLRFDRICGAS
jgi:hypothetical protein